VFYFMAAAALVLALVAGLGSLTTQPEKHLEARFAILTPQERVDQRTPLPILDP
jgi:hypothetical protein